MTATVRRHAATKRLGALLAILGLALLLCSCKAQQANMKLKKANELLGQAEQVNAQKYAPDLLTDARNKINEANTSLAGGDAAAALASAKLAVSSAEQAVEKSKSQYATDISNEAKAAVDVARLNQGETEDAQRFQNIQNLYGQISAQWTDKKWDDVIATSRQVLDEVDLLLKRLKNESERTLVEAQNRLKALKAEGGQEYAPERVIEVTDLVNQVETYINDKKDYINARNQAELAVQKAREGIDATKREKSKEQISMIEALIVEAMEEGAELYAPEQLKEVNGLYDSLTADFQENRFDKVLLTADVLKPKAEQLVFATKKAAANGRIEKLVGTIGELTEAGVQEYLPGRIDVLQEMLANSRTEFQKNTNEAFDQIKQIGQDALSEENKIRGAFDDLAQEEIRKTGDQLDKTQAVFNKMASIFIIQPRAGMAPIDLQFENAKQTLHTELATGLKNASDNLEAAGIRQRDGKYRGAIELAKDVATSADAILNEIYHVVAFNAAMELSQQVTRYELDGAQEYATEELRRTKALLEDTKNLMGNKQYKEAVSKAADTRAQLELMVQRVAERGSDSIEEAKATIEKARSAETVRYRRDELNAAVQLNEAAQNALAAEQLKNAVELAQQATVRAKTAAREAMRLAAEDELENSRSRITRAQNAGANQYAAKEFDDAKRLLQSAERHFTQEDFTVARDVAVASSEKADRSFYKLIDAADAAINEAKSAGGWDLSRETLARAIAKNDEARRVIESGAYDQSASLAQDARDTALAVAVKSKLKNYDDQVKRIKDNLEKGRSQGITMFQVKDAVDVNVRLVELQDRFDRGGLTNYEFTMAQLQDLEARLRNTLDTTTTLVKDVIAGQRQELDELAKAGADSYAAPVMSDARANLKFAEIDFRNELYKSAHENLSKAIDQVKDVKRRQAREEYLNQVQELFLEVFAAESRFTSVLTRTPKELKTFAMGEHGSGQAVAIASVYSPNKFREEIEKTYSKALQLKAPEEEAKTHQEVMAALTEERLAALDFEKMIVFKQMTQEETNRTIDRAYDFLESAHNRISTLQRQFSDIQRQYRETEVNAGLVLGR